MVSMLRSHSAGLLARATGLGNVLVLAIKVLHSVGHWFVFVVGRNSCFAKFKLQVCSPYLGRFTVLFSFIMLRVCD